jgi:hypothetical protein
MSKKQDYSETEWKAIAAAPVAAGLLVSLSDASGVTGLAKEAIAVGRAISDTSADLPEVVRAIGESTKSTGGRPQLPEVPNGNRAETTDALTAVIKSAVETLQAKSPAETDGYKSWLVSVAVKVAHASKEGGFLGFGGTVLSTKEQEALDQLAGMLGVSGRGNESGR